MAHSENSRIMKLELKSMEPTSRKSMEPTSRKRMESTSRNLIITSI